MFTGIVEGMSEVVGLRKEGGNLHISMRNPFARELKIDQSVAHNGVCLTVVDIDDDVYTVTAIDETLKKSNLGELEIGSKVNVERSMRLGDWSGTGTSYRGMWTRQPFVRRWKNRTGATYTVSHTTKGFTAT